MNALTDNRLLLRRHRRLARIIAHVLCIGILFILPEVLMSISRPGPIRPDTYLKSIVFVTVFYANYYWIINRTFGKRHFFLRLALYNVVLTAVAVAACFLIMKLGGDVHRHRPPHHTMHADLALARMASRLIRDLVMIVLTIALSVALKLTDKWQNIESRSRELEAANRQAELRSLKNQLNPHFLFNTLNSIYALIDISPAKARDAVHELSKLLRYVLYENRSAVSLDSELRFIDNYIRLMKLRLNPAMEVNVNLDAGGCGESPVAPLIFIAPVENAFKHGNTGLAGKENAIDIDITATHRPATSSTVITCRVSNAITPPTAPTSADDAGIGTANLARRLELIYGDQAAIDTIVAGRRFTIILTINLQDK